MKHFTDLWNLIGGHRLPSEDDGPARRTQIIIVATFASAVMAAVYGVALAGGDGAHAVGNLYRMPLVILLASAFSLPAALLAWRISGTERPPSDMAIGLAAGTFTGTLVLAVLAPVVALYVNTTTWLGPVLGLATAFFGVAVGLITTWRAVLLRAGDTPRSRAVVIAPLVVLGAVHLASLTQLIAVSSLMPEVTFLDQGLEGLARH